MELNKNNDLIVNYVDTFNLVEELKDLFSEDDKLFANALKYYTFLNLRTSKTGQLYPQQVALKIQAILKHKLLLKVSKIIKESKDINVLNSILSFVTNRDKSNKINNIFITVEFSQQIAERVLVQENYELFQLFLSYIEFKNVKEETKLKIKNILNLGQDINTNQEHRKKLQQKFKELETEEDFKYVSICSIINLERLKTKLTIKAEKLEQILQIFKLEKTDKSQRVLQTLLKLDLPTISQFVQTAAYTKFTVDTIIKYQQNQTIHSSFFTKQNILLFCSYLNTHRKINSLYLFASKQSLIQNQKGIYLLLPIEAYPKTMNQQILNLTNQISDLLLFTRTILLAIKENKPIYTPFEELTLQKKITLLAFCFNIFRYIPEYDDEDGSDINLVTQSNLIPDAFTFLIEILDKKQVQNDNEIVFLFSTLIKGFIIYPLDTTSLPRLQNSGIIQSIYKILTSYQISINFYNDLLYLYEHQFRNILRACNKIDLFQTTLLIDKIILSMLSFNQINTSQMVNLVSLLIQTKPAFQQQVKTQITQIAQSYLTKPKQYFQNLKHSIELKIIASKLNLLFRMKSIKLTTEMKLMNIKLKQLTYESSHYKKHNAMDFDILDYKDIDMKQSEVVVSLDKVIELLKSQEFRNSFTFNSLKEKVNLDIHKKFFDGIYSILAFMNYHSKDVQKVFAGIYEKIVEVYVIYTEINFNNHKVAGKGAGELKEEEVIELKQYIQEISYVETQSLFDYFVGVGQIYAQNLDFLLRVNTKSIVPYAAKVPLSGFMKCLGKFLEVIKKSQDTQQIIFFIRSLEKIWQFSEGGFMSVQSYYYLYTTYQTEIFQIANKLFDKIKGQIPHFKSLSQKSKTLKQLILQNESKENKQKRLFYGALSFLRVFILRKLTVFSWVAENQPNEYVYGNTRNLALGIYLDQFTRLVSNLNQNNLLFYKTLLKKFFNRNIQKTRLFEQQNVSHKRGNNLRARRQVVQVLNTMGYGSQVVEMVLNQLQDMSIDGAIDWINNHHQQIQSLEQTNLIRQTLLNSINQKPQSQKSPPTGIRQLSIQQYNTEFKQPLKTLFKKHFISAIYNKNKDKLPQLIILLIQRYDKQQTRNSNYVQFMNYLIKELNNEVKNNFDIERIIVQFNHLSLILEKCITKKEIRQNILKSSLITDLVKVIHNIGNKQKIKEEEEKVFNIALKIIKVLVPKRSSVDISRQLDSILDELVRVKEREDFLNIDEQFWALTTQRLVYPISEIKLHKILNILFKDLEENKTDCNYGQIIETVLQSDHKFLEANIESEIKTYFFNQAQTKIVSKLKREFVIHFERYNNNPIFYKIVGQILKKKNEKLYNNRKATYLIYEKDKHSYSQSIVLQKPFIQYSPTQIQVNILQRLFSIFSKQSESTKLKFNLLHRILERFSLLRHYCLFQKQNNTTFIDQILNNIPYYKSKIENILTLLGSTFGVIFKQKEKQYYYSTYIQYYIAIKLREILEEGKDGNESSYISLCYLLQFKLFNNIANENVSENVSSLRRFLEKQFRAENQFISEPLTLLYKQMTIKAISSLYVVADQDSLSEFQSQLILLPLMCVSQQGDSRSPLERLEYLQLGLDALADPNEFLARLQGGSSRFAEILRRQLVHDAPFEFLPIQPKGQRKQSKVSNQGQIQKVIQKQQQPIQNQQPVYILNTFDSIPIFTSQNATIKQIQQQQSKAPNYSLFNEQLPYIAPREYKFTYVTKMNQPLYKRINLLWKQLSPEEEIVQKKQDQKEIKKVPSLLQRHSIEQNIEEDQQEDIEIQYTRRLGDGLNPFGENVIPVDRFNRNIRMVRNVGEGRNFAFEVDFGNRRRDIQNQHQLEQQRQQQQQQQQQLNEAQIQKVLQQYVQQKIIEVPKIVQKVEQKIEQKLEEKVQQKIQKKVQQKTQKQQQRSNKIDEISEEKQIKNQVESQKVQQKSEDQSLEKTQQKVEQQNQNIQQKKQQTNEDISPSSLPSPPIPPPSQVNTNPPIFRQILQTVGVPQNFLRMHGVIEQQFDSMPQQVKVDLLFQLISSQQQPQEAKHDDPIPIDILQNIPAEMRQQLGVGNFGQAMTQTQILLASIDDQQMRQQIFLQASPQIIAALPVVLQQQAQAIRQRRIRQIAAQQQQQDMIGNHHRRRVRRNRQTLVYPQVSKQLFQKLDTKTLFQIVRTLFFKASNNSLHLLQSVIQNKQNQEEIINTLIYILRSPLNVSEFPSEIKQKVNNEWKIVSDGSQLLTNLILTTLQRIVKSSPYKDTKFLKQKISYNGLNQIKLQPKPELFIENYVNEEFHYPFIEILTFSLKSNLSLSTYLLEGLDIANIPKIILQLVVETFKSNNLPEDYVNNLKGISNNSVLKELFISTFSEKNHPKISVLAQILKYPFSRVDYLKALHLKILNSYKPEYNKFLNEIYRIYTIEELKNMKGLENFKSIHKQVIKDVLKTGNIFIQPISIILKLPFLIDFETKRQIFYQKVQDWNQEGGHVGRLELRIDRNNLFSGSFSQIAPRTKQQMRGKINVTFEDEGAYDAGGPTKQWFLVVSREMFNQNYALFQNSSSGNTYHPSSKSYINPDHLRYFKFIGRIVGKALMQKCYIDAYFTRSFYKMILGQDLTLQDMQSSDFNFYKSMLWVKDNKIEDDFYRFAYDIQNFGKLETIELIPNGKNIEVTQENKHEFVQKICLVKMKTQTHEQIKAFLQGFHQLIPIESIQYFTAEQLELLISGLPTVDIQDLKKHTEYQGYTENSKQIVWFWEILQTLDQQYLTKMIQFITGTSKIPPEGFKGLRGMHGSQKISIHKDFAVDQLPKSHTCFNQLDLPQYPTKQIMQTKLKIALNWGSESFGFM